MPCSSMLWNDRRHWSFKHIGKPNLVRVNNQWTTGIWKAIWCHVGSFFWSMNPNFCLGKPCWTIHWMKFLMTSMSPQMVGELKESSSITAWWWLSMPFIYYFLSYRVLLLHIHYPFYIQCMCIQYCIDTSIEVQDIIYSIHLILS